MNQSLTAEEIEFLKILLKEEIDQIRHLSTIVNDYDKIELQEQINLIKSIIAKFE